MKTATTKKPTKPAKKAANPAAAKEKKPMPHTKKEKAPATETPVEPAALVDLSVETDGARRLFAGCAKACFGRKFSPAAKVCKGDAKRQQCACSLAAPCEAVFLARCAAGVTDPEDFRVAEGSVATIRALQVDEAKAAAPSRPAKPTATVIPEAAVTVLPPVKAPEKRVPGSGDVTTITEEERVDAEEKIRSIETGAVRSTLRAYIDLGTEYARVRAKMAAAEFAHWVDHRMQRSARVVKMYMAVAQGFSGLAPEQAARLLDLKGLTLTKLELLLQSADPDQILRLAEDARAEDGTGVERPLLDLGEKDFRGALPKALKRLDGEPTAEETGREMADRLRRADARDKAAAGDDDDEGVTTRPVGLDPDPDPLARPVHPLMALLPIGTMRRTWMATMHEQIQKDNIATLPGKDLKVLSEIHAFLKLTLLPDLERVLDYARGLSIKVTR